jgi:hypothetical protein
VPFGQNPSHWQPSSFPSLYFDSATMTKLSVIALSALVASAAAFAPQQAVVSPTALKAAATDDGVWDPLSLMKLGQGESFDTFPNVFPHEQFLREAEIKHGRQAMLAWTGIWTTTKV